MDRETDRQTDGQCTTLYVAS